MMRTDVSVGRMSGGEVISGDEPSDGVEVRASMIDASCMGKDSETSIGGSVATSTDA
jgi:hypothetical protein